MRTQLTAEDFNRLVRYFGRTAFRLEVQPVYDVSAEQESVREFLAGNPRPVTQFPFYAAWLEQIRVATAQGKRIERVRVLEEPPTDYQRWEMWSGRFNAQAGERIRYLTRSEAGRVGLPVNDDWWLFDGAHVAVMRFGPGGTPQGGEIISDEELVRWYRGWWDLAIRYSRPLTASGEDHSQGRGSGDRP